MDSGKRCKKQLSNCKKQAFTAAAHLVFLGEEGELRYVARGEYLNFEQHLPQSSREISEHIMRLTVGKR